MYARRDCTILHDWNSFGSWVLASRRNYLQRLQTIKYSCWNWWAHQNCRFRVGKTKLLLLRWQSLQFLWKSWVHASGNDHERRTFSGSRFLLSWCSFVWVRDWIASLLQQWYKLNLRRHTEWACLLPCQMQHFLRSEKSFERLIVQGVKQTLGIFGRSEVSLGTSLVRKVLKVKIFEKVSNSSLKFQTNQLHKDWSRGTQITKRNLYERGDKPTVASKNKFSICIW